ncbi:MAG: 2-oxoglutarate dehydrogenase E1 component [Micavibrio sp.]|nr:2-oxoglutarate dehydrogenase E1 component [Micavibrio sp.]
MSDNLSFLTGINSEYITHLYAKYLANAASVDQSWQSFFGDLADDEVSLLKEMHGASWTPDENRREQNAFAANVNEMGAVPQQQMYAVPPMMSQVMPQAVPSAPNTADQRRATLDSIRAIMLIRAFRVRGHLEANLDPLGLAEKKYHPELDPRHYGFTEADYDRQIFIDGVLGLETASLHEILVALKETYCGTIGVEFMHMVDPAEKAWVQERIEAPHNKTEFTVNGKRAIYQRLIAAEGFENFLHIKHTGTKRFGIDGGESLIPCIEQIMKRGGQLGMKEIAVGMAHRGRLNVLTNVMGKSFTAVFSEFQGQSSQPDDVLGSGDVKYHMGTSSDRDFDGNTVHLSLTANPSHLEFVNPVVIGKVRAKQTQMDDTQSGAVLPLLLHGDAAFAGQGVVPETLMISELPGYRVGGTMHIVINNQIGFTTRPKYSRSGPYCTDVAKLLSAPIFHVNGDDPEAVVHVARIATEFRQKFKKDVVIDMFCYRRFGHNEGDEPSFTQPLMYKQIKQQKTTRELYAARLVKEKVLTEEEAQAEVDAFTQYMEESFEATKSFKPNKADYLEGAWSGLTIAPDGDRRGQTDVEMDVLKRIGQVLTTLPEDFKANSKILRQLKAKEKMFESGEGVDWGTAEAMAFGTLLDQGFSVRLSGQDCGRGTFSQRHAKLYDQETEKKYTPLKHISSDQPKFEVHDSPLSELAVMGFEYGYALADPKTLVMWEGQFGDFVNGAQVIIDQFISSGETKWLRMCGLVLMLPHGMEGQGPEHSSARLERFLQSSAEDNWQVANCTTPANYFHILRRQMCRDFRKPLILMTPKSLLRHKLCVSNLEDFGPNSTFHRLLWDHDKESLAKPEKIKRVVFCSGKVYYDLLQERRARKIDDVMLIRLEQLYPFPHKAVVEELNLYSNAEMIWCQEEPKNMGAWTFVEPLIEEALIEVKHKAGRPKYVGRIAAASPATGLLKKHNEEQAKLVDEALSV